MSRDLISPVPMTSAFGGVATGNMKAHEAPIPIISTNTSFGIPIFSATAAKTGTSSAAEAVLLVNSVRKMIKVATTKMTTSGETPPSLAASICPISSDAPDAPRTLLRVIPPPKRSSTPQSALSVTSFQLASPNTTTAMMAQRATKVSGEVILSAALIWLPQIQAVAAATKTTSVSTRCLVHGIGSALLC